MGNLLRMDLYRMWRAKSFKVCLILAFAVGLGETPLAKLLVDLGKLFGSGAEAVLPKETGLSSMIASPLNGLTSMLVMLSVVFFFYADMENGYIKNIAGQMPKKGYSILSRFLAVIPHNLVFMVAALVGNVIGTCIFIRIVPDDQILSAVFTFLLKLVLLQSICSLLVLVTSSLRNKALGVLLAVLIGLQAMNLIYLGIDKGLQTILGNPSFSVIPYMPDMLMMQARPDTVRALASAAVTAAIFLPLAIRVFDRRDVK